MDQGCPPGRINNNNIPNHTDYWEQPKNEYFVLQLRAYYCFNFFDSRSRFDDVISPLPMYRGFFCLNLIFTALSKSAGWVMTTAFLPFLLSYILHTFSYLLFSLLFYSFWFFSSSLEYLSFVTDLAERLPAPAPQLISFGHVLNDSL